MCFTLVMVIKLAMRILDEGFPGLRRLPAAISLSLIGLLLVGSDVSCLAESARSRKSTGIIQIESGMKSKVEGDKSVSLTTHEKEIAKQIGFDEKVLELLKERLHPEMGIVKSGGLEQPDMVFVRQDESDVLPLLDKDRENYGKLEKQFPELKPLVEQELRRYSAPNAKQEMSDIVEKQMMVHFGPEKFKRYKRFVSETSPAMSIMRQEVAQSSGHSNAYGFLNSMDCFESDAALEKAIAEVKASVAGKILKPENRATQYLGLRFNGIGDYSLRYDRRITELQTELEKLGYRITEDFSGIKRSKVFETRAEAEKYLSESGTGIDGISLREQKAETKQITYPPDEALDPTSLDAKKRQSMLSMPFLGTLSPEQVKQMEKVFGIGSATAGLSRMFMPVVQLLPGATVEKIGERKYLVDTPARYTAFALKRVATVMKVPTGQAGFEMVRSKQTNGLNYNLDNEKIIAKLKYWDAKYGVTVLEAKGDGLTIRFKKLPDDLSELCTEIFLFCPEMELHENENSNAAAMRKFAKSLRETKTANFWWD